MFRFISEYSNELCFIFFFHLDICFWCGDFSIFFFSLCWRRILYFSKDCYLFSHGVMGVSCFVTKAVHLNVYTLLL